MANVIASKKVKIKFAGRTADEIRVNQFDDDSYSLSKTSNSALNVTYSYSFGNTFGTDVPVHIWIKDFSQNPPETRFVKTVNFSDITSLTENTDNLQM